MVQPQNAKKRFSEVIHVSVHITGYSPRSDTVQLNIFEPLEPLEPLERHQLA